MLVEPSRRWPAAFAADLHLEAGEPAGLQRAERFFAWCGRHCESLYLLGDVFDVWPSAAMLRLPELQPVFAALRASARESCSIHFLPGNRDFLFTAEDGRELSMIVAAEEELSVVIDGASLHLLHGDQLLLRDVSYQRYKWWIRSRLLRALARRLPSAAVYGMARRVRGYSSRVVPAKLPERLDVVAEAVEERLLAGASYLLCGHLHRARRQTFGPGELLVLPPFLEDGAFLLLEGGSFREARVDSEGSCRELGEFRAP